MEAPLIPSFGDLGQSARDVFKSGYHYGKSLIKMTAKVQTSSTVQVDSNLQLNIEESKLRGVANAQYQTASYGNFLQKWTTDGTVTLGYTLNGTTIPHIGLLSEVNYNPETKDGGVKFGVKCAKENINALCSLARDFNSNITVFGSLVTAIKGLVIGYEGAYSTGANRMTKNDIGMLYNYNDVAVHFRCISIPHEYGISLYYKVNEEWETAIDGILVHQDGIQNWTLGIGAKYQLDEGSTFRCKFNTNLQLGVSLQQKLDESVMLTLSYNIDCANVTKGGHKIGLALDFEG